MDTNILIATLVVAALTLIVALGNMALTVLDWRGGGAHRLRAEEAELEELEAEFKNNSGQPVVTEDALYPPFPAPMVGPDTLKQWLVHRYNRDNVWSSVVDDFYVRAASHHKVRPYFEGRDLDTIKKKFLATILIVTDKGVSEPAAAALVKRHAHLGITGEAYDATIEALVITLDSYGVRDETISQMVPMLRYFRETMVTV